MKQKLKYVALGSGLALVLLLAAGTYVSSQKRTEMPRQSLSVVAGTSDAKVAENMNNTLVIREMDFSLAADVADDKVLMGASHNVFVGKVIEQTGTRGDPLVPVVTQFAV